MSSLPRARLLCSALVILGVALPLVAQTPAASHTSVPSAAGARRTSPIAVDGRLDEAAWAAAKPITEFRQTRPNDGAAATLGTEIRLLYDDDALYVGARMNEPNGRAGVRAPLARRDQLLDRERKPRILELSRCHGLTDHERAVQLLRQLYIHGPVHRWYHRRAERDNSLRSGIQFDWAVGYGRRGGRHGDCQPRVPNDSSSGCSRI